MSLRRRASFSPRQSCSSRIRAVIRSEASCAGFAFFVAFLTAFFSAMETPRVANGWASSSILLLCFQARIYAFPRNCHDSPRTVAVLPYTSLAPLRVSLIETKPTAGRERCGVGLRLAYWVAQVCNAGARDHRRVAKDGWRAGEVVEESNSGAKKNR